MNGGGGYKAKLHYLQKREILYTVYYYSHFALAEIINETDNAKNEFEKTIEQDIVDKVNEVLFETRFCQTYSA